MINVILHRSDGSVIAAGADVQALVVEHKANLRCANLIGASLGGANLSKASLSGANLRRANLIGANLREANLIVANLSEANLSKASLSEANLRWANLSEANLSEANLRWANLSEANLIGANLSGANLSEANLYYCVGNSREIITTQTRIWTVTRTADVMQIGCERHAIADWWAFTDAEISKMDKRALEWWQRWKPILQQMVEAAPAVPTGYEVKS